MPTKQAITVGGGSTHLKQRLTLLIMLVPWCNYITEDWNVINSIAEKQSCQMPNMMQLMADGENCSQVHHWASEWKDKLL